MSMSGHAVCLNVLAKVSLPRQVQAQIGGVGNIQEIHRRFTELRQMSTDLQRTQVRLPAGSCRLASQGDGAVNAHHHAPLPSPATRSSLQECSAGS